MCHERPVNNLPARVEKQSEWEIFWPLWLALSKIYLGKPIKLSACNPDFSQHASSDVKILACGWIFGNSFSEPAGTIRDVLVLFTNGTAEPHVLQKDLENSLEGCS
jgi:hypothetical protein